MVACLCSGVATRAEPQSALCTEPPPAPSSGPGRAKTLPQEPLGPLQASTIWAEGRKGLDLRLQEASQCGMRWAFCKPSVFFWEPTEKTQYPGL